MLKRLNYIAEKVFLYVRRFGWRGPIEMFRLYWLYLRGHAEPVFVRLYDDGDGIWIRPAMDLGIFHQVFVHDEYGFELATVPSTIIDAGANIGCASVYFARRFPEAKIAAIEPTPSTIELLKKNVAHRPNVMLLQAALWSENESIELVDEWNNHLAVRVQSISGDPGRVQVQGMTFQEVLMKSGFTSVDILKMDIEGAEEDVFTTAADWLPQVRKIIIEFHDDIRPGSESRILEVLHDIWRQTQMVVRGENVLIFPAPPETA
jgi:FkbM family methyltransferase